jgi:hypothetical protein
MKACSRFVIDQQMEILPVSAAAVAAATAVESATTAAMEASTADVAVDPAACESASNCARSAVAATITVARPSVTVTGTCIAITGSSVVPAAIAIHTAVAISITAPEPRAGTDKDSAAKPRRTVVSVRSASVGSVTVVAVGANRSRVAVAPIHRAADPDTDRNLSVRISRRWEQQDAEKSEIS